MAKIRGSKRFFRIGLEADPADVAATAYGTPATGYEDPAVTGANKDMRFFQVSDGGFSLKSTPLVEEQPVLRGQNGVHHRDRVGQQVGGDISVLAHPETVKYFLDAGLRRDSAEELVPHTIQEFYPGIDSATAAATREVGASYIGCKVSQLSASWGTGNNRASITTTWTGQREKAYINNANLPLVSAHTKPKSGYYFTNSALIDMSKTSAGEAVPVCDYTEIAIQVANNLAEGPRCFDPDSTIKGAISDLLAGQERISGSFTLQWKNKDVLGHIRDFDDLRLRSLFIHPTANSTLTATGAVSESASAVTNIGVSADPTSLLSDNSVVAFQHKTPNPDNWSVARLTAARTGGNEIDVESLDIDLASGDVIWTEAMEFTANTVNITDADKSGGPNDAVVTISGTFEGKADTSGDQITYKAYGTASEDGLPRS